MFDAIWKTGELAISDPATHRLRNPLPSLEDAARCYARLTAVEQWTPQFVEPALALGAANPPNVEGRRKACQFADPVGANRRRRHYQRCAGPPASRSAASNNAFHRCEQFLRTEGFDDPTSSADFFGTLFEVCAGLGRQHQDWNVFIVR
jgi:hypothetical protein